MLEIKQTIENQQFLNQLAYELENILNQSFNDTSFKVIAKPSNYVIPDTFFLNILSYSKNFKNIPTQSTWYNCHTCHFVGEKPNYADKLNFVEEKLVQRFSEQH